MAAESPFYLGLKAGKMMVDPAEFEDATSSGLVFVGYKFSNNPGGSLAIEGEYTNSSSENITILGTTGKWDIDTIAVYVAYRTGGDLYFKGKAGYLHEDVSANIAGASISGSDSGLSLGIGAGLKIGKSNALELEYTIVEEDVSFLSLGFNFGF
jgi:hypothetical protein